MRKVADLCRLVFSIVRALLEQIVHIANCPTNDLSMLSRSGNKNRENRIRPNDY